MRVPEHNSKQFLHAYRRLAPYVFRQRRWLAAIVLLTIVCASASALQPLPMKFLVDYALGDAVEPTSVADTLTRFGLNDRPVVLVSLAAVCSLLLSVLVSLLGGALTLCWTLSGQRMIYDLAHDVFSRLQRLSLTFHRRRHVGDSLSRITDDTWCLYSLTDGLLVSPFQQIFSLCAMGAIAFALDPFLAGIALAMAPFLGASSFFFGKRLKRRSRLGREAKSRITSFLQQTLGSIPVVQAFSTEERNTKRFDQLADDAVVLTQRGNLLGSSFGLVHGLITTSGTAAILCAGGIRVLDGVITLGTLLVFISYVGKMQNATGDLFKIYTKLKTAEAGMDRVLEILDNDERVREREDAIPLPDRASGERGHVQLRDVTFGYELDRPVLRGVNVEFRRGEAVALVGPTGAGKSTLVSLIPRYFDPWNGTVSMDGIDLRALTLESLRSNVSIVLQDPYLLPRSIAENIAFGRPEAGRDEIIEAAIAANADEFIRNLPDGYDTVIGERGSTLSGGERQRLSVARALLKDAPVLILDEPTSALDTETEASVLDAFDRLMEGRTTIIIAHRLSTIRNANRIVVLEAGRIIEQGSHQHLMDAHGAYHRMYEQQFGESAGVLI